MASPGPRGPSYQSIDFLVAILFVPWLWAEKGGSGGAGAGEGLLGGLFAPTPGPGPECRPRRGRENVVGWDTPGRTQTGGSEKRHQGPRALSFQLPGWAGPAGHSLHSAHSAPASPQAYSLVPGPGRLNVPSPCRCFSLHFGEDAPDSHFPRACSGSGDGALGGALLTPTAEFAPLLGPFERSNF